MPKAGGGGGGSVIQNQAAFNGLSSNLQNGIMREIKKTQADAERTNRDVAAGRIAFAKTSDEIGTSPTIITVDSNGSVFWRHVDYSGKLQIRKMTSDGRLTKSRNSMLGGSKVYRYNTNLPYGNETTLVDLAQVYKNARK